jgi:alpha-methylacyl-CoA racemase
MSAGGPLSDLRVIELPAIGPAPFAVMVLADLGADVTRIDRPTPAADPWARSPVLDRGRRRTIALDLKQADDVGRALELIAEADVLVEGFRPGVMERLGLGPAECRDRNPRLVYVRMTGWGQEGPMAARAGHDITYLATTGVLHAIGDAEGPPAIPLNLLGDFGGGGMFAVCGALAGVLEARRTGHGRTVDAAIVDGVAVLSAMIHGFRAQGAWSDERADNLLDSGAPFYAVYPCADGFVAVGALERRFFDQLVSVLGLDDEPVFRRDHLDRTHWAEMRRRLGGALSAWTRAELGEIALTTDCCVAPVLTFDEAATSLHNAQRAVFVEIDGVLQPAPAPRFSDA